MVVLSQPIVDNLAQFKTCKPAPDIFSGIPVVDLSDPNAKARVVEACREFGFFKLINHGVSMELFNLLEARPLSSSIYPSKKRRNPALPILSATATRESDPTVMWAGLSTFSSPPPTHTIPTPFSLEFPKLCGVL
ncbi:UNVERIFIED_CONTAM: Gibberellin 2-beta-dioxygenase [Sesamum angustifolium]|uniref:Gibberellin 2-beta-dioxygenase n=1 Tax=Sesamum angustifolium TaxID=2727405 RepID=A0AAW2KU51_9LAMI